MDDEPPVVTVGDVGLSLLHRLSQIAVEGWSDAAMLVLDDPTASRSRRDEQRVHSDPLTAECKPSSEAGVATKAAGMAPVRSLVSIKPRLTRLPVLLELGLPPLP